MHLCSSVLFPLPLVAPESLVPLGAFGVRELRRKSPYESRRARLTLEGAARGSSPSGHVRKVNGRRSWTGGGRGRRRTVARRGREVS